MSNRRIMLAVILTALMASAPSAAVSAQPGGGGDKAGGPAPRAKRNTLAGTWVVTADPVSPPPGFPEEFSALHTYTADGRFVETSATNPAVKSAAHGEWGRLPGGEFATTFLFFVFDPAGAHALTVKVRSTVSLSDDGEEWSGPFEADFTTSDGNLLFTVQGTHRGRRVVAERL